MRMLVVGGSGSGKSACAERLACALSARRTYVATMESQSAEAQRRIARHRAQRDGLGFITLECSDTLPVWPKHPRDKSVKWPKHPRDKSANGSQLGACAGVALVEDLGNLVANTLFAPDGSMEDARMTIDKVERNVLDFSCAYEHVVVVGNLVGCEGFSPYETTQAWVRVVGTLCCRLAACFDVVIEVTAGIPQVIKGVLP